MKERKTFSVAGSSGNILIESKNGCFSCDWNISALSAEEIVTEISLKNQRNSNDNFQGDMT